MAAAEEATTHRHVGISSLMRQFGELHAGFSRLLDEHKYGSGWHVDLGGLN